MEHTEPNATENGEQKQEGGGGQAAEAADLGIKEWAELCVRAGIWALILYAFAFQVSEVKGPSMYPTYHERDRLLIDKLSLRIWEPERGEVVVFSEAVWEADRWIERDFIKRVIGLPGETVEIKEGAVWIDGERLDEQYDGVSARTDARGAESEIYFVPPNSYFVLGDNRPWSNDSRWGGAGPKQQVGFVARRQIKGRVRVRFWPWVRSEGK
jgi:signal peptidase I